MTDQDEITGTLETVFERSDPRISVAARLTRDRLKLFVDVRPVPPPAPTASPGSAAPPSPQAGTSPKLPATAEQPPLPPVTKEQLLALLGGVPKEQLAEHDAVIADIVDTINRGEPAERRRISKGTPPQNGRNGKLVLLVKKYQSYQRSENLDIVDPRYLHLFDNVEKDFVIGRIYPPTAGTDGVDAVGAPIKPEPGKPFKVTVDQTAVVKPASPGLPFETIVAQVPGYVTEDNGRVIVHNELVIDDSVGFKTGDIEFVGSLTVRGSVLNDFQIKTRGNVLVGGDCENCSILSTQGAIAVSGSVIGEVLTQTEGSEIPHREVEKKTYAVSGAEFRSALFFKAALVNGVSVEADGDIEIGSEAKDSILRTRAALRISKGHLFGGEVYAVHGVEVARIGTGSAARTVIHLCTDVESSFEYANLLYRMEQHASADSMLCLHLGPYAKYPDRIVRLREPFRSKLQRLSARLAQIRTSYQILLAQKDTMIAAAKKHRVMRVNFLEAMFRGTIVTADNKTFTPDKHLKGPRTLEYFPDTQQFVLGELKPLETIADIPSAASAPPAPKGGRP